jgi:hypothetical protein
MFANFANFARSFDFLLGAKPLWSMLSHFGRCFPVSHFARSFQFCSEFLVLVGAGKSMNRNSRSWLQRAFLLGPTKTQNPNIVSEVFTLQSSRRQK